MMNPPPRKPPCPGGPSSPSTSSSSSAPQPPSPVTLPPISTIYNFTSADTASAPGLTAYNNNNTTTSAAIFPPRDHNFAHDYGRSDQASFSTWITAANSAELAEADGDDGDYDDDTNFVFENGRRYHANADGRVLYPLPNDESEQERDDMKHKLALWMMHEKLFYAPVEETLQQGGMVIDLGTPFFLPFFLLFFLPLFLISFTFLLLLLFILGSAFLHAHPSPLSCLLPVSCMRAPRFQAAPQSSNHDRQAPRRKFRPAAVQNEK